MKIIVRLFFFVTLVSCTLFEEKLEHQFVYSFENKEDVTNENIDSVKKVFSKRLRVFGNNFEISSITNKDITVKIKSNTIDKERINNILINQGKLEFWECFKAKDVMSSMMNQNDSLTTSLFELVRAPANAYYGVSLFNGQVKDTLTIHKILNHKRFKNTLRQKFGYLKFLKGLPESDGSIPYFAIKSNKNDKALVSGENIIEAIQDFDYQDRPTISIQMDEKGSVKWEYLTGKAFSNATAIAIVVNDLVYSAPSVTVGAIKEGRSQISGDYSLEEAQDLAIVLSAGGRIPKLELHNYTKSKN